LNIILDYHVRNIGHSPALNVWVCPKLIAPSWAVGEVFDPRGKQLELIAHLKHMAEIPARRIGFTLFPGDDPITLPISVNISADELQRITERVESVLLTVIGAVNYRFTFSSESRQTGFIVEIHRSDRPRPEGTAKNRHPTAISPDEGDIPADDLRLRRSFTSGGYAD
jgi:hypothetical protein